VTSFLLGYSFNRGFPLRRLGENPLLSIFKGKRGVEGVHKRNC